MKKKYIIGAIILCIAAGYLIYLGFSSSTSYYVTVSEFYAQGTELYDTGLRIAGKIIEPINWDSDKVELSFTISEGGQTMPVVYAGVMPGNFQSDSDILVEGSYDSSGVFKADQLILKCPSKYEIDK